MKLHKIFTRIADSGAGLLLDLPRLCLPHPGLRLQPGLICKTPPGIRITDYVGIR